MCKYMHKVCNITTADDVNELTVSNANGVKDKDPFCLEFTTCTANLSGSVSVNINGSLVPVYNKYSEALSITDIAQHKVYHGYYVDGYVILHNVPQSGCCSCGRCAR